MATGYIFHEFVKQLGDKKHNLGSDSLKFAFTTVAPVQATDDTFSDLTEIAAANGYSAGGIAAASVTYTETGGVATLDCANPSITASGGSISVRYVVLYNDTASNDELIKFWDLGSTVVIPDTQVANFNINAAGILTLTIT